VSEADRAEKVTPIDEELLDRCARYVEGPLNERAERFFKNRVVLAAAGLAWTATCRTALALRDRDITWLFRRRESTENA
jgi:hypothetical protein